MNQTHTLARPEHDSQIATLTAPTEGKLTTQRGTTHLSLGDLEAKVSHYPPEIRAATGNAQRFFVEHCDSNVEKLMGIARNALKFERSPGYFSNWLKGQYFVKGGGKLKQDSKGYSEWMDFCEGVADYARKLRGEGRTIVTGTIRAIEDSIADIYDLENPCRIGGVAGATGTQKTEGLKFVALKRGGFPNANYFDCPEGLGRNGLKRGIGDLFNVKVGNKAGVIDREIARQLDPTRGLYIDNIQRGISPDDESVVVDWLLRMQEWRNFPLYLTFTKGFREKLSQNSFLEQLTGRMGGIADVLVLNDYPPKADLRAFARHYALADSAVDDFLLPWSRELGRIRVVAKRLWRAKQFAKADGETRITLDYLKEVDKWTPPASVGDVGGAS